MAGTERSTPPMKRTNKSEEKKAKAGLFKPKKAARKLKTRVEAVAAMPTEAVVASPAPKLVKEDFATTASKKVEWRTERPIMMEKILGFLFHRRAVAISGLLTMVAAVSAAVFAFLAYRSSLEQSQLDQRAWIGVEQITLDTPYNAENIGVTVSLRNTGKTPGKVDSWEVTVASTDYSHIHRDFSIDEARPSHCRSALLELAVAPNVLLPMSIKDEVPMSKDDFEMLTKGKKKHVCKGVIHYRDAFDAAHVTEFTFIISGTEHDMSVGHMLQTKSGKMD